MARHQNIKLNKGLGQHFLKDEIVLHKIYDAIKEYAVDLPILEVGPGGGSLTKLLENKEQFKVVEFDNRWANLLAEKYPKLEIINQDFLELDLESVFENNYAVVGNFPYNISSQIVFHIIDHKDKVPVMVGMFQKEVAKRICSNEGTKDNGILSILTQLYYDTEYLFDVPREAFNPPPKVVSGVMAMKRRNDNFDVDFILLKKVVKMAFNQRRKTLRNSLKPLIKNDEIKELEILNLRPEQLNVAGFVNLTNILM